MGSLQGRQMSVERQARLDRWYGLWAELDRSEAYRLRGRIRLFGISFRTLEANYRELLESLERIRPQAIPDDLGTPIDNEWVIPLQDICRYLHNYLAATSSLIDHMRVLYRDIYKQNGLIPNYQTEVDARFIDNGVTRLVSAFRNINMHCHHLMITYTQNVKIDRGGSSITSDVFIRKDEILAHGKLHAAARTFLESSGNQISLESIIRRYHDTIVDFYEWFSAWQQEIHSKAFGHVERIEQELREIKAAERAYFENLTQVT